MTNPQNGSGWTSNAADAAAAAEEKTIREFAAAQSASVDLLSLLIHQEPNEKRRVLILMNALARHEAIRASRHRGRVDDDAMIFDSKFLSLMQRIFNLQRELIADRLREIAAAKANKQQEKSK